jgi:hypothetical protein
VAEADHSTVGGKGSHMVLWALLRDLAARSWGKILHDLKWDSRGGAHLVAPEAASKVKTQAEAKYQMYSYV